MNHKAVCRAAPGFTPVCCLYKQVAEAKQVSPLSLKRCVSAFFIYFLSLFHVNVYILVIDAPLLGRGVLGIYVLGIICDGSTISCRQFTAGHYVL